MGIGFEFLDAVDGADGFDPASDARIASSRPASMTAGECACALSHTLAYRRFLDSGAGHLLVLEDDAVPIAGLARFVHEAHYRACPMLLLFHSRARVDRFGATMLFDLFATRRLAMACTGAVAYSLDRNAARRLLEANTPVRARADWPMDISTLGARALDPMPVQHPPRDSRQSCLEASRRAARRRRGDPSRFLSIGYVRRRWLKAVSVRIS